MLATETRKSRQRLATTSEICLFEALPDSAHVPLRVVAPIVGLGSSTIYARVNAGRFPMPIKITTYASRWRVGEIRTWLADPLGWRAERGCVRVARSAEESQESTDRAIKDCLYPVYERFKPDTGRGPVQARPALGKAFG